MSKITIKFLFLVLMIAGLSESSSAQIPADIQEDIENRLALAENTAVTNANGQVIQISIRPTFGTSAEVLQLGYDNNGLSSVTDSRGVTVTIQRNQSGAVSGFTFPNSGSVDLVSKGCGTLDTFNVINTNKTIDSLLFSDGFESYRLGLRAGNACRDAAWSAAVGLAICTLSGPGPACWIATANAAYYALRCYEETHPT